MVVEREADAVALAVSVFAVGGAESFNGPGGFREALREGQGFADGICGGVKKGALRPALRRRRERQIDRGSRFDRHGMNSSPKCNKVTRKT